MPKTFTMYAVPYARIDKRGTLDVFKAGAMALFSSRSLAEGFLCDSDWINEPVKVRVMIEKSGAAVTIKKSSRGKGAQKSKTCTMILSRTWEMPSIWTFKIKSVASLLEKYQVGLGWADPFAGENSPAEFTNDIEGRGNKFQLDALDFMKSIAAHSVTGVLFDPPYSVEQCLRRYTPRHGGTAGRAEYWAKCKDEIARITKWGG